MSSVRSLDGSPNFTIQSWMKVVATVASVAFLVGKASMSLITSTPLPWWVGFLFSSSEGTGGCRWRQAVTAQHVGICAVCVISSLCNSFSRTNGSLVQYNILFHDVWLVNPPSHGAVYCSLARVSCHELVMVEMRFAWPLYSRYVSLWHADNYRHSYEYTMDIVHERRYRLLDCFRCEAALVVGCLSCNKFVPIWYF